MTKSPFEASSAEILRNPDEFVDAVFLTLESEFLVMPKGVGFVDYALFEKGYEALKAATCNFVSVNPGTVSAALSDSPVVLIVVRTMLGMTPPEWAYVASERTGLEISQGAVRSLDRKVRLAPNRRLPTGGLTGRRISALIETACTLLTEGAPDVGTSRLHRLDKADTKRGVDSIRSISSLGAPYAMLLYERFLGRPFAGHRDSVSELIGDSLESAIEDVLAAAGISYRKTKRAESLDDFDQAPDFVVPSEFNPQVVIEAKITEDDGTARDKVTRIQHLCEISRKDRADDSPRFQVIACIGGRGFGVRREDMKKMIIATRGKVFTARTLDQMVANTRLNAFVSMGTGALEATPSTS
jgi:hypothetical protein